MKLASVPTVKSGLSKQISIVSESATVTKKTTGGIAIGHYDGGFEKDDEEPGEVVQGEAAEVLALDSSTFGYVAIPP